MKLRNLKIAQRFYLIMTVIFLFIVMILLIFSGFITSLTNQTADIIGDIMLEGQKQKIMISTQSDANAIGELLRHIEGREKRLEVIRNAVRDTRYEKDLSGYFFVYENTVNIAFPTAPAKQGLDLRGAIDTNGVAVIVELDKVAHAGGGFVKYLWQKPDAGLQPKISFATMIPGTEFWIGTGVYLDNIEKEQNHVKGIIKERKDKLFLIIIAAIVFVLALVIVPILLKIISSIIRPIKDVVVLSESLALGDLDVKIDITGKDEFSTMEKSFLTLVRAMQAKADIAQRIADKDLLVSVELSSPKDTLGISLQKMENSLRDLVAQLHESSTQIDVGSNSLAAVSNDLSNTATQQAASIEQVSSSMDEVNGGVKLAAARAAEANALAQKHNVAAKSGVESMKELMVSIGEINESNSEISKIINVIEDITFQTNLLALNAAVEAARAGQHGKGFAVVADEVRNLASRSSKAAHEVTDLIGRASERVERGTVVSAKTGEILETIGEGVSTVAELLEEINKTTQGQAASISQINEGIALIGDATQGNAASSEESASAAHELSQQAISLRSMIDEFSI